MPTIQYPKNPNTDTAFVVQDDGTKNRALMTAPQDISTLELPNNPNSTKGYVTVDGKKQRVILTADIGGGGGGGDQHNLGYYATQAALEEAHPTAEAGDWAIVGATDTVWIWDEDTSAWVDSDTKGQVVSVNSKTGTVVLTAEDVGALPQYSTMPVASSSNSGLAVQYTGATNASYTHDYIYENVATTTPSSATASQTTGSSLTDVAVVVATFETQITTSGSYVFTSDGVDWSYDGNVVDLTDYGITYTGTPVADDAITVVYTAESTSYAWTRVDVQPTPVIPDPLPSQTGNAGKVLITNGSNASWGTTIGEPLTLNNSDNITNLFFFKNGNTNKLVLTYYHQTLYGDEFRIKMSKHNGGSACNLTLSDSGVYLESQTPNVPLGKADKKWKYIYAEKLNNGADITIPTTGGTMVVADYTGASQGDVLTLDSTGNATWAAPSGGGVSSISVTLPTASWSGGSQTVTATGVTASNTVIIGAAPASQAEYTTCGVICTAQGADSLTFTATSTPTNDLSVTVLILA